MSRGGRNKNKPKTKPAKAKCLLLQLSIKGIQCVSQRFPGPWCFSSLVCCGSGQNCSGQMSNIPIILKQHRKQKLHMEDLMWPVLLLPLWFLKNKSMEKIYCSYATFLQNLHKLTDGDVTESTAHCLGYRSAPACTCSPKGFCYVCTKDSVLPLLLWQSPLLLQLKNLQPNSSICYHQGRASCLSPQLHSGFRKLGELPAEFSTVQELVWIHKPFFPINLKSVIEPWGPWDHFISTIHWEDLHVIKSVKNTHLSLLQTSLKH